MPFRADLDRHGLEDEPEIHVRDGDAGVLPVWHGHVEVGFGASTELDHPLVVRVAAAGFDVLRLVRPILAAPRLVQVEPPSEQLLPSLRVDEADLLDRLPATGQEALIVRPALVERHVGQPRWWDDRIELRADAVDELRDLQRRARRLDALDAQERALTLLVREVQLQQRACDERAADQRDEDEHVLPKELSLPLPHKVNLLPVRTIEARGTPSSIRSRGRTPYAPVASRVLACCSRLVHARRAVGLRRCARAAEGVSRRLAAVANASRIQDPARLISTGHARPRLRRRS